jgi:ATP dependent DNA ligase domain
MKIDPLPAGFVVPAHVKAPKPPVGSDWVHEIERDGYRIIVRRDGPTVRLYSRNAYDWTVRLAAIAAAAEMIKAKSFTIDGEAVVLGPDGLSQFEELSRREAARTAILYAFDLIERHGKDLRNLPFLDRKAALAQVLRNVPRVVQSHAPYRLAMRASISAISSRDAAIASCVAAVIAAYCDITPRAKAANFWRASILVAMFSCKCRNWGRAMCRSRFPCVQAGAQRISQPPTPVGP